MIVNLLIVIAGSALLTLAIKALFPKRRAWVPVTIAAILPPLVIFPVGFYYVLVDIGRRAEQGHSNAGMVSSNAPFVSSLIEISGLWPFVAVPTALAVLHIYARIKSRP